MPLPYPDMNFTPFDPLTATEMNQLVANIEALQDWSAFEDGTLPKELLEPLGTDQLEDGAVTAAKIADEFTDYSTSEVNTGAKWIDGKDIYKKTVNCGNMPNTTTKSVAHGISGIDRIVDHSTSIVTSGTYQPLPYISATGSGTTMAISIDGTNINLYSSTNFASSSGYVTIYYTKT